MTKFRIFGPAGIEICTIEADSRVITPEKMIFYEAPDDIKSYHEILTDIPYGWVAIPDEIIVKEENKNHAGKWILKNKLSHEHPDFIVNYIGINPLNNFVVFSRMELGEIKITEMTKEGFYEQFRLLDEEMY